MMWLWLWLSRLLCSIGCHDWRNMDGKCCKCGYVDEIDWDRE